MNKPNCFLVGGVRSGTTSLFEYLGQHPQVFAPAVKGIDFFGEYPNDGYPKFFGNLKKYLALYKKAKNEKILLDASHYFHVQKAPENIKKFNPSSKIVIILRNPLEIIQSQVNNGHMGIRGNAKKALSQKNEGKRLLIENLKFSRNIKNYIWVFGEENVYITLLDDWKKNPEKEYKKLCNFLELREYKLINFKVYSPSSEPRKNGINKLLTFCPLSIRIFLKENLSVNFVKKIKRILNKCSFKEMIKKKPLPLEIKEKLRQEYKNEILKTSKLINRDLSFWLE